MRERVGQAWPLHPSPEVMQTLAQPRPEDGEATGKGSSPPFQKAKRTFGREGMEPLQPEFHTVNTSDLLIGERWAGEGVRSDEYGSVLHA